MALNQTEMTLPKVLWTALTASLSIILLMTAAWANDMTTRSQLLEARIALTETRYAAIQVELAGLREDMRDVKTILQKRSTLR